MFPKPKNERLAIGTFVGVFALDALLTSGSGTLHTGLFLILLAINFPGFLLITGLTIAMATVASITSWSGFSDASDATVYCLVGIAALFSAAFWSYIFGYVFPLKRAA